MDVVTALVALVSEVLACPGIADREKWVVWFAKVGGPAFDLITAAKGHLLPSMLPSAPNLLGAIECAGNEAVAAGKISPELWRKIWEVAVKILPLILPFFLADEQK